MKLLEITSAIVGVSLVAFALLVVTALSEKQNYKFVWQVERDSTLQMNPDGLSYKNSTKLNQKDSTVNVECSKCKVIYAISLQRGDTSPEGIQSLLDCYYCVSCGYINVLKDITAYDDGPTPTMTVILRRKYAGTTITLNNVTEVSTSLLGVVVNWDETQDKEIVKMSRLIKNTTFESAIPNKTQK